ncbi:MAG: hypothetical protein JWP88_1383 [Flaviaesturariibacter sp.]|nr:hypothetical protein [Flaviaesturariibacter sp.]
MSERFQSPGGHAPRREQSDNERQPASGERKQTSTFSESQRARVRKQAFDRIEEGDEGQGEWESSARSSY